MDVVARHDAAPRLYPKMLPVFMLVRAPAPPGYQGVAGAREEETLSALPVLVRESEGAASCEA